MVLEGFWTAGQATSPADSLNQQKTRVGDQLDQFKLYMKHMKWFKQFVSAEKTHEGAYK